MDDLAGKRALKVELVAHLAAQLATATAAHRAAVEGATHGEARPENDKDTRGLEQSYLARGQAMRVAELERELAETEAFVLRGFAADDPIALGALVTADDDGATRRYFVAPHGGGHVLTGGIQVVTPRSPLGQALLGRRAGDACELRLRGGARTLELESVA